jgi:lipopolysaccharide export system protein LptC
LSDARSISRDRLASLGASRQSAFPTALRHTQRVARLRKGIVWGVGGIVAVCGVIIAFQSLRFLPIDLRFAHIAMKGSRIVLETPKLVGYRKDGRPYELEAALGVQDMATPDRFELEGVKAKLDAGPDRLVQLTATAGVYDSKIDRADLTRGVRIFDEKSYDLRMPSATMDFRASRLSSKERSTLTLNCCEAEGDSIELAQTEQRVTFVGGVRSVFRGEKEEAGAQAE